MSSRAETTAKFATAYVRASKADQVLGQVVEVTGCSRDNAPRRLRAPARPPGAGRQVAKRPRRQREPKYSYDALKVLQKVWAVSGGQWGRYLEASMALQLAALERHDELVPGQDRYSPEVRAELLAISSATIDRYLRPVKARDQRAHSQVSNEAGYSRICDEWRTRGMAHRVAVRYIMYQ